MNTTGTESSAYFKLCNAGLDPIVASQLLDPNLDADALIKTLSPANIKALYSINKESEPELQLLISSHRRKERIDQIASCETGLHKICSRNLVELVSYAKHILKQTSRSSSTITSAPLFES